MILAPAGSEYVKHVEALPIDSDMSDHALILFSLEVMRPHAVKKTITFLSYRNVDNNSIVYDIEHILNILDVSFITAGDCTIWYNNFFNPLENKFFPLTPKHRAKGKFHYPTARLFSASLKIKIKIFFSFRN